MTLMIRIGQFGTALGLALILIWWKPEVGPGLTKQDYVESASSRFVMITSECRLGSGFLTGYREEGKAEVVTAYHLIRCGSGSAEYPSDFVWVDGVAAEIRGEDPDRDLLRLLVPLPVVVPEIPVRTEPVIGEPVFTVGSNPQGERSVITWGHVLFTPPGEVTAQIPVPPGTSGGQLISAIDGALLGMVVREEFGFTNAVSSDTLLWFMEKNRSR